MLSPVRYRSSRLICTSILITSTTARRRRHTSVHSWKTSTGSASHRHMRIALASGLLCGLVALSLPVSGAEERWRKIKGASLQSMFQDKEFGDGVHFAYRFKLGGTFSGTEMSREVRGSWRVTEDEMCWKWVQPAGAEECYQVQQDGVHVRLLVNGSEAWYGTLQKAP